MKKKIYSLASIVFAASLAVTSCNSPSKKAEKAQENVEEERQELMEAKAEAELQQQKAATAEEWKVFKSDSEVKKMERYFLKMGANRIRYTNKQCKNYARSTNGSTIYVTSSI